MSQLERRDTRENDKRPASTLESRESVFCCLWERRERLRIASRNNKINVTRPAPGSSPRTECAPTWVASPAKHEAPQITLSNPTIEKKMTELQKRAEDATRTGGRRHGRRSPAVPTVAVVRLVPIYRKQGVIYGPGICLPVTRWSDVRRRRPPSPVTRSHSSSPAVIKRKTK